MSSVDDALLALRRSEERYRSLVEATALVVWTTTPDGRVHEDLPAWREITGQSPDEVLGHGWLDAVHPDDRARVAAAWQRAVRTEGIYAVQYRVRAADGGIRHLSARGVPVFECDGSVREWVGTCTDVTARVALEHALAEERLLLQQVVEQAPAGVMVTWGPDHVYRLVNQWAFGLLPDDRALLGRRHADAIPEAGELVSVLDRVRVEGEQVRLGDLPVEWASGKRFYDVTFVPLRDEAEEPGGVLVAAVETTAEVARRRALEEELAGERRVVEALQRSLLPGRLPDLPGVHAAARYLPAGPRVQVGGDWYDLFALPDRRVGLVVGDVAGRGVPAASAMSQTRAALRAYAVEGAPPGDVVRRLDELVCHLQLADLTTLVYAVVDPASRRVAYANAGHLPPLVVAPGLAPALLGGGRGAPLGAGARVGEQAVAELPPRGTLLLYTDGLIEGAGASLEAGIERLAQIAGAWDGGDLSVLCDAVMAEASGDRERPDDVALLVVSLSAAGLRFRAAS
jgi:PAS domain S-box-containing protein